MTDNTSMLERLGDAIEKAANVRAYGLYDYSAYPESEGGLKPHVVRDELTRGPNVVFDSDSPREAREFYEAAVRRFIARAALEAIREPSGVPFTDEVVDTKAGWQTPHTVWRDTIDAILSETPPNG